MNHSFDVLVAVFEAGFATGSGRPALTPDEEWIADVVRAVQAEWEARRALMQAAVRENIEPRLRPEEVPEWLRHLQDDPNVSHII